MGDRLNLLKLIRITSTFCGALTFPARFLNRMATRWFDKKFQITDFSDYWEQQFYVNLVSQISKDT